MKLHTQADVDRSALSNVRVAVLGYGSQGRAHALNLRDSKVAVQVGLRPDGPTWRKAEADGFHPQQPASAVREADIVMMLAPDMAQPKLYRDAVAPNLQSGAMVMFAHGFNIHFAQIDVAKGHDVSLVAPKGPGDLVRREYQAGRGVPCLMAVHRDESGKAHARTLAYADAIGGARAGVIETTFAEETETDLFGEQAVLCGGVTELVMAGFETLVEAGYQAEVAYFECLHELKLIVDLMQEGGLERIQRFVSETATFGQVTRGRKVIDASARARMREILSEVRDGTFAREWVLETQAGRPVYRRLVTQTLEHPIEQVGRELRARMAWLRNDSGERRST